MVGGIIEDKQTAGEAIKEAFKNKSFIYLTLGFFVCGWHITLIATHIPAYLNDRGLPDWYAATLLSMIGLFNIFGTLTSGYLSTKFPKKLVLSAIYLMRGVVIALFILPNFMFSQVMWDNFEANIGNSTSTNKAINLYLEQNIWAYFMELFF